MKTVKSILKYAVCLLLVFTIVCPSIMVRAAETNTPQPTPQGENQQTQTDNIATIAENNKDLTTLTAALKAAGLVDVLEGEGPFTVFAPTNDAFSKLPKETLDNLLKPENKEQLEGILTYHVFAGNVPAATAEKLNGKEITMLNGKPAKIEVRNGALYINDARVVIKDIKASNGVIHVIDTVLIPSA